MQRNREKQYRKTRALFQKIRDTRGTFHAKMGSIKDRNHIDLKKAEDGIRDWPLWLEFRRVLFRSMNYEWRFVTLYKRQGSRPSLRKRNAKKQNGCPGRPYKYLWKEEKQKAKEKRKDIWAVLIRSDQISRSVMSDSLRPHESQHARPPCPSPTPEVHSDSRP